MADMQLVCNQQNCRKVLKNVAWITSCSHAFCEDDINRQQSSTQHTCPACQSVLADQYDVVKVDLNPSEQFKSMVLVGLRPDTILDVAYRAMAFWLYQTNQERVYQEVLAANYRDRVHQMEEYNRSILARLKAEIQNLRRQVEVCTENLEKEAKRAEELAEQLADKSRQYQKLQAAYESMRRCTLATAMVPGQIPGKASSVINVSAFGPKPMGRVIGGCPIGGVNSGGDIPGRNTGFRFTPVRGNGPTPPKRIARPGHPN